MRRDRYFDLAHLTVQLPIKATPFTPGPEASARRHRRNETAHPLLARFGPRDPLLRRGQADSGVCYAPEPQHSMMTPDRTPNVARVATSSPRGCRRKAAPLVGRPPHQRRAE